MASAPKRYYFRGETVQVPYRLREGVKSATATITVPGGHEQPRV